MNNTIVKKIMATHLQKEATEAEVQNAVEYIMNTVNFVNSFDDITIRQDGVMLDEIEIPSWAGCFVYSATRVSLATGNSFKDLIERPGFIDGYKYDPYEIRRYSNYIARLFKTEMNLIKAVSCRTDGRVTLSQVKYSVNDKCVAHADELYIPTPLISDMESVLGNAWHNMSAERLINDFIAYSLTFKKSNVSPDN